MSVLVRGFRPRERRADRPSVREVCLLSVSTTGPDWVSGNQVTLSGRAYRVEMAPGAGGQVARRYVHLSASGSG